MDPRINKLAQVLVHYSLEIKPGQQVMIDSNPLADELTLATYREALDSGAHVYFRYHASEADEILYKHASDTQLEYVSPVDWLITETFDALLFIGAPYNTRALSNIDPVKQARRLRAREAINKLYNQRAASGELKWCLTIYPTQAVAQEAEMSLAEYQDFLYTACKLNETDPIAAWQQEGQRQKELQSWLEGKDQLVFKGKDIDLKLSIAGRSFECADGKINLPDGEIFTGPVEESVNGWVRFRYPAIYGGREVTDIELWFEGGKVVREKAAKGQELLTSLLNTDAGARYLGELGIGTNYDIPRFSKNMLFDEKLGGTIHLATGQSYPETGGKNESGLHWDMLCDMHDSEIVVDGEVFYRNGKPVLWE